MGTATSMCDDGSSVEYNWRIVEIPSGQCQAGTRTILLLTARNQWIDLAKPLGTVLEKDDPTPGIKRLRSRAEILRRE